MNKEKTLTGFLRNIKLASALRYAYYTQREIERQIKASLANNLSFSEEIVFSNEKNSFLESFKKNFFSLLMLSALKNTGINHGRVKEYGKIIFGLRTIVTCTDNIIALEIITQALDTLEDKKGLVMNKILENIHQGIEGELLTLSITAPLLLEDDPYILEKLQLSKDALFLIGDALQKMDDLCDKEYIHLVMEEAFEGFSILESTGYPLKREDSLILLNHLFKLKYPG